MGDIASGEVIDNAEERIDRNVLTILGTNENGCESRHLIAMLVPQRIARLGHLVKNQHSIVRHHRGPVRVTTNHNSWA